MANYTTTITNEGAALLASVIANQGTLTFNEFRFSENDYTGQESTLTEGTFLGVFITASAAASVIDLTTIKASAQFNNSTITGNHNLYSIGIVGTDGNTTALIAVCTTSDPDVIREPLTGVSTYAFNVNLTVSDTSQINVFGTTAAVLYDIDVVDTLISTATDKPLSANMGRVLGDNVEAIVDVYGAKNLLPYPYKDTTKSESAVTFTDNGDGTVTISGTASANANFALQSYANRNFFLPNGTYKLGTTNYLSGMYVGVAIHNQDGTTSYYDTLSGEMQITINGSYDTPSGAYVELSINVFSGTSIITPITVKPMIRDARITDDTFVSYAPTNYELMSYKSNGRVGAKNLLRYPFIDTTQSGGGLSFTDNGDGTITIGSGTATADVFFNLRNADQPIKKGTYILSGCPSGGSQATYMMYIYNASLTPDTVNYDTGDGVLFNAPSDIDSATLNIKISNGTVIPAGGLTFKPMIRIAEDTDLTFAPYAKTNQQLTADSAERADIATINTTGKVNMTGSTINAGTFFYLNGQYCKAITNIAVYATFTLNTNYEAATVGGELNNKADKWTLVATATGDGVKTWAQVISELTSSYDASDFYKFRIIYIDEGVFYPMNKYSFVHVDGSNTGFASVYFRMINTNTNSFYEANGTLTPTDYSSNVFSSGYTLKLYKIG